MSDRVHMLARCLRCGRITPPYPDRLCLPCHDRNLDLVYDAGREDDE